MQKREIIELDGFRILRWYFLDFFKYLFDFLFDFLILWWRRFERNTHSTVQENRVLSVYSIFFYNGIVEKHKLSKLCEWFFIHNYFNSSDSTISLHFMEWPKVIVNPLFPFWNKSFLEQRSFINVVVINFENVDFFHAQLGLDVCLDFCYIIFLIC